jgi:K+ transporter
LSDTAGDAIARPLNAASLSVLGLSALGVVFGDIGTSPLYTLKTVLTLTGGAPDTAVTLGVLSLVIWTLIVGRRSNTCPLQCASTMTARAASLR